MTGAAETRAQAHRHTPHIPARNSGVQAGSAHKHTHPNTQAWSGGAQPKPEPKHTHPRRTAQPEEAGYKRRAHTNTQTPQHPSQEWRGAPETRAQAHTPTPQSPARRGGVQAGCAHKHTHTLTPQPGVAGHSAKPSPNTHMHTAHPSQEWRRTSGARTQAQTGPNTPARSGGAQPRPEPKHTHPHRTAQPGVPGYKQSAHANTHTPHHPSQEWQGAAETRTQAQPRPKHKRLTTVENQVSIAHALRQPMPCR